MKSAQVLVIAAIAMILVACDPGISIRQINNGKPQGDLIIQITTAHQLIGESWYSPHIRATNRSSKPIVVAGIELVTSTATYDHKAVHPSMKYPVNIAAGETEKLPANFRFQNGVYKEFKNPAELRIHYRVGSIDEIARATVIGGSLSEK